MIQIYHNLILSLYCNKYIISHTLTAVSVSLLHVGVLILENQRQRVKIAVHFRTMDR